MKDASSDVSHLGCPICGCCQRTGACRNIRKSAVLFSAPEPGGAAGEEGFNLILYTDVAYAGGGVDRNLISNKFKGMQYPWTRNSVKKEGRSGSYSMKNVSGTSERRSVESTVFTYIAE